MRVTFRGVTTRHSTLIRGPYGWGEFAPFPEYDDAEAAHWLSSALEAAYLPPTATVREQVPVNATLPAVPAHRVPDVLNNYNGDIQELKIKVAERGQTLDDDIARVAAARTALPDARLKIDANAGWTLPQAFTALTALSDYNLLYAEQPVGSINDMRQLRTQLDNAQVPVLIAADELVRKADDPLTVARAHAADLIVVKAAPLGGVRRASAVIAQSGLPAVISSALETSVGIATGVHLAASLPKLPYGCGLGTVSLLNTDVSSTPLWPKTAAYRCGPQPRGGATEGARRRPRHTRMVARTHRTVLAAAAPRICRSRGPARPREYGRLRAHTVPPSARQH